MDIFIIEDDKSLSDEIKLVLNKWGYKVGQVNNFENITNEVLECNPKLILMDINLPSYDGFYWCSQIRNFMKLPIIFISSRDNDMDIIMSINMGGDDYITKPFSPQVLVAKIQAILRRTYSFSKDFHLLTYQDVHLDILAGKITYQQKELILTKNELKILEYLFEHAEVIVSRIDLMNHLWDDHQFIDDNTLSVNMNRLRKKLEDIGLHDFIHTKKGLGYLLCLKTI